MKLYLKIIATFILAITLFACVNDETTADTNENLMSINYDNAFENKIGFLNQDTKSFTLINESKMISYWNKTLELSSEFQYGQIKLYKAEVEENEDQYYILNTKANDGKTYMSISTKLILSDFGFEVQGETCVCESTDCNFGCEVLSMCSCSSCARPGVCKKKHTLTTNLGG